MAGLPTTHTFQTGDKVKLATSCAPIKGHYFYYTKQKVNYIDNVGPVEFGPANDRTYTLVEEVLEPQTKTSTSPNPSPRSKFRLVTPVPEITRIHRKVDYSESYDRGIAKINLRSHSGTYEENDVVVLEKNLALKITGGGVRQLKVNDEFVIIGLPKSMSGKILQNGASSSNPYYDVRPFKDFPVKGDSWWKSSEHYPVSAFVKA